jgi:hypothetical protein
MTFQEIKVGRKRYFRHEAVIFIFLIFFNVLHNIFIIFCLNFQDIFSCIYQIFHSFIIHLSIKSYGLSHERMYVTVFYIVKKHSLLKIILFLKSFILVGVQRQKIRLWDHSCQIFISIKLQVLKMFISLLTLRYSRVTE